MTFNQLMSRRAFLAGTAAATGASGLALAGCGGGGDEETTPVPETTSADEPKRGGTLQAHSFAPILGLDPSTTEGAEVAPYFYSYVVHSVDWLEGKSIIGDLAESWETPDDNHWIFKIRGNAVFQDLLLYEPYGYWVAYDYLKGYKATSYGFGLYKFDYWIDKG